MTSVFCIMSEGLPNIMPHFVIILLNPSIWFHIKSCSLHDVNSHYQVSVFSWKREKPKKWKYWNKKQKRHQLIQHGCGYIYNGLKILIWPLVSQFLHNVCNSHLYNSLCQICFMWWKLICSFRDMSESCVKQNVKGRTGLNVICSNTSENCKICRIWINAAFNILYFQSNKLFLN